MLNTIYLRTLAEGYAARASNLHNYLAINRDVTNRWLYPLVPDAKLGKGEDVYKFHRHNVYKSKGAQTGK